MNKRGQAFVQGLSLVFVDPPRIRICEYSTATPRTLCEVRNELNDRHLDIIGKPGIYLDRSETGMGKSTADIQSVCQVDGALIVAPTHENCAEIETSMVKAGIFAMKYPARSIDETEKKTQNCWNKLADDCEAMGLSVTAVVCPTCLFRESCLETGYLAQLEQIKQAKVAIATHARAIYNKFDRLSEGRCEFIAIHEDAADTICPQIKVSEGDLQLAADVLNRVLNDPKWLNWLGESTTRDESGVLTPNENLAELRDLLDQFVRRLADVTDSLLVQLRMANQTLLVEMPPPLRKAIGIEKLLFRAGLEHKVQFSSSPWRLLLATLTGELFSLGVILDERTTGGTETNPAPA